MAALSEAVVYMLVVLIEFLHPISTVVVDYIQDSVPAMVVTITSVQNSDNDLYLIDALPASALTNGSSDPGATILPFRIEQSDLFGQHYVVFAPTGPPVVLDLTPIRRTLSSVNLGIGTDRNAEFTIELDAEPTFQAALESPASSVAATPASSIGASIAGPLHILHRPPYTILADGPEGILLIAR